MKKGFLFLFAILALFTCGHAFAADAGEIGFWQHIADQIPEGSGTLLMIATLVLDMVMRLFKTEKPISVLRMIAVIFKGVAIVFDKAAKLLDAILGNRAQLPADPVVPPKA